MWKRINLLLTLWAVACVCEEGNIYKREAKFVLTIFNGNSAIKGQFPYQAYIYKNDQFRCGASIIHNRWLLTAAHCKETENVANLYVKVGSIYRDRMDGQRISIEKFIQHEEYEFRKVVNIGSVTFLEFSNDIALIRLSSDVRFNDFVRPIKLAKDDRNKYENVTTVVSGLGRTHRVPSEPEEQQYIHVKVISDAECERSWPRIILKKTICTSVINGRGICKGDSGGPLVYNVTLIGIVSASHGDCSRSIPNIYTRVSSFIPWINRQLSSFSDTLP